MVLVVMGVSGSGKTTVGVALAARLGWPFLDADDPHSTANRAKMHAGVPLTDEDRAPWLAATHNRIAAFAAAGQDAVVASSALKQSYRDQLRGDLGARVQFVYLTAPREVLAARLQARHHEFMPPTLLPSQLDTLEPPTDALRVDVSGTVEESVEAILRQLPALEQRSSPKQ